MSLLVFFSEKIQLARESLFYSLLMLVVRWYPPSRVVSCYLPCKYSVRMLDREEAKSYSGINLELTQKGEHV